MTISAERSNSETGVAVHSSTTTRLISRLLIPVVLIVFAAPFITLLFYSVPAADDFCNASLSFNAVPQRNVLSLTWLYYTQWSPRWLTALLDGLLMSHVDLGRAYGWLLLAVMLTNVATLWYFFLRIVNLTPGRSFLVAAVFYSAWVASIAKPDEQLYWLTNVIGYNLSLSSLLILASLLLRPYRSAWYSMAVALLSIAIPAQSELAGTFLCVVVFAGATIVLVKKLPGLHWYLSLVLATISMMAVMLSPGNALRAAAEHKHLWDTAHLPHWVGHSFYHGVNWLGAPAVLTAAFCIVLLSTYDQGGPVRAKLVPTWFAIASLCAMLVVLVECALVEVATSSWLPDRVVAWFEFVFWLLFVCVVLAAGPEIYRARFSLATRIGIFALLSAALVGSSNFRAAVDDSLGPAQSWWRIGSARLKQRGRSLEFEAPAEFPKLAKPQMLTDDPGCWVNRCLANYLHASTVVVRHSKDECPH